jgi:hypothetical protein
MNLAFFRKAGERVREGFFDTGSTQDHARVPQISFTRIGTRFADVTMAVGVIFDVCFDFGFADARGNPVAKLPIQDAKNGVVIRDRELATIPLYRSGYDQFGCLPESKVFGQPSRSLFLQLL